MARNPNRPGRRRRRDDDAPDQGAGGAGTPGEGPQDGLEDDATPAPDPLKHGSADVDQALLAEAGAQRGESGEAQQPEASEPLDAGEYETDPAVADERAAAAASREAATTAMGRPGRAPKQRGRAVTFLRNCVEELRRVQWPDRKQVGQATAVVLGFVVLAGGYLGLMDAIWKPVVEAIL